jgi:Lon protease-like protein
MSDLSSSSDPPIDLSAVPLFPLPGVVLFPRAVLPLHIFEDRYRAMTRDALVGARTIAMALLRPGWEKSYYGRPVIEPVVCVGTILSHEKLPDGKYNFLLQGQARARIVEELSRTEPYRIARLERIADVPALEIDLGEHRQQLTALFDKSPLQFRGTGKQFRQIVRSVLTTPDIADLAAFTFLEDVAVKQSLLAEADVRRRVAQTIEALQQLAASLPSGPTETQHIVSPSDPHLN